MNFYSHLGLRVGVLSATAALFLLVAAPAVASSSSAPAGSSTDAWSVGSVTGRGAHPNSWAGVCAGEFYESEVVKGVLGWGGEQSCTNPYDQSLEIVLYNLKIDLVDVVNAGPKVSYQLSARGDTKCTSTSTSSYVEYAYGYANGKQANPYPAKKTISDVNCHIPSDEEPCISAKNLHLQGLPAKVRALIATKPRC